LKDKIKGMPITVAARSTAWNVSVRSNTVTVGSNPTQGLDVCVRLFCVCVVLCVYSGLATGWSLVQGVLLTVYMIKKMKANKAKQKAVDEWMDGRIDRQTDR
jgi:hypothetical protein